MKQNPNFPEGSHVTLSIIKKIILVRLFIALPALPVLNVILLLLRLLIALSALLLLSLPALPQLPVFLGLS